MKAQRFRKILLATTAAAALVLGPVAGLEFAHAQNASAPPAVNSSGAIASLPSLSPLVQKVMPAVVNISVVEREQTSDQSSDQSDDLGQAPGSPFDQYLRRFFENHGMNPGDSAPHERQVMALGSGFIIDPSGLVVTNNHVVDGAKKVTVLFQDGTKHPAKILGRDPKTDLALLKVDVDHPLPYVSWGDSRSEKVGDWVVAIGNPFGLGGTVSAGIISARGRDIGAGPYDDFLQIDAPINRGNSGGPTFNLEGQVVGINTAIYSPNGGSVGIGFAIPSDLAKPIIDQIREHGKVTRGWLGVQIQEVTPSLAKALGLPNDHGALVADVTHGSPAEKAGVKPGDVIESFNGHPVDRMRDLPLMVAETPVGSDAKLQVWRDHQETTLSLDISQQPANLQVSSNEQPATPEAGQAAGVRLEPLTPDLRRELHVGADLKGVVVRSVSESSPLASIDVQPGDVIESVNQQPVTTPDEATEKLKAALSGPDKRLVLLINRHGVNQYVALSDESNQG